MENYVTKDELDLLIKKMHKTEIQAHISINFAFIALTFCKDTNEVLKALERGYEAGLTELTFSHASDEDIEFFKNQYSSYIEQVRLLSR